MSDEAGDRPGDSTRPRAGSYGPSVPFLSPGERVDHGPAGSLRQRQARLRAARDPVRHRLSLGLRTAAAVLLVTGLLLHATAGPGLLTVALAAAAFVTGTALHEGPRRLFPDRRSPAQQLAGQVRAELLTAKALDRLRRNGQGWTVLHDRLLPGTEHRLAHVVVGPVGVVVVGELPAWGRPSVRADTLFLGENAAAELLNTRWWEAQQLELHLEDTVAGWRGPVFPLLVVTTPPREPLPPVVGDLAVRTVDGILPWLGSLPAPLGEWATADLADAVRQACPPAAAADPLTL